MTRKFYGGARHCNFSNSDNPITIAMNHIIEQPDEFVQKIYLTTLNKDTKLLPIADFFSINYNSLGFITYDEYV